MECHRFYDSSLSDKGVQADPVSKITIIISSLNLLQACGFIETFNLKRTKILQKLLTCSGALQVNGSRASIVTIHGEIVVPVFHHHNPKSKVSIDDTSRNNFCIKNTQVLTNCGKVNCCKVSGHTKALPKERSQRYVFPLLNVSCCHPRGSINQV